ncbi:hypothetical protein CEXT_773421 [Caerostris extrusa]|uniref:Uncharacterized protein n=1 Tax=Caerostris extrusa TaxID=172846 RepID=A0AAV4PC06_CAEEX|nr:hypothetical protein CEXT_773421 [Caerostris extrusa]
MWKIIQSLPGTGKSSYAFRRLMPRASARQATQKILLPFSSTIHFSPKVLKIKPYPGAQPARQSESECENHPNLPGTGKSSCAIRRQMPRASSQTGHAKDTSFHCSLFCSFLSHLSLLFCVVHSR